MTPHGLVNDYRVTKDLTAAIVRVSAVQEKQMEASCFRVTPVTIFQEPWPQISEALNLHQQSCDYLKSHKCRLPSLR